jgi:membrane dipeptidase
MSKKKRFVFFVALGLLASLTVQPVFAIPVSEDNALQIHYDAVVVDTHSDTLMKVCDHGEVLPYEEREWLPKLDLGELTDYHIDIPKLQEGGVDVQYFGAFVAERYYPGRSLDRTLALINGLYYTVENNPDTITLAKTPKDIDNINKQGKIAAVSSIEGGDSIVEPDGIELLRQYADLGVRAITLTWSYSNSLCEGINKVYPDGTPSPPGLTELGEEVVQEMNRLGIAVDVSHLSVDSFWDVMEISEAPIMASHSCAYTLLNHDRNLTDDQINAMATKEDKKAQAVAKKGGIVQINFYTRYLSTKPSSEVTAADIVDHIDYVVDLVGVEHVGLGSDFDGARMPADVPNAAAVPEITKVLIERGYSKSDIEKILGGNSLRYAKEVWERSAATKGKGGIAPSIVSLVEMGDIFETLTPYLAAQLTDNGGAALNESSIRIIIDGEDYSPEYDAATSTISLQVAEELQKGFHVVTFEAANEAEKLSRETVIFFVRPDNDGF